LLCALALGALWRNRPGGGVGGQNRPASASLAPSQESSEINRYVSITPSQRDSQPARHSKYCARDVFAQRQSKLSGRARRTQRPQRPLSLWVVTRQCEDWSLLPGNSCAQRRAPQHPVFVTRQSVQTNRCCCYQAIGGLPARSLARPARRGRAERSLVI
jgi:hypothetical protein